MLHNLIKNQVITEKSSTGESKDKYTFIVNKKATKVDIKRAFQEMYGVKVASVNMIPVKPKTRYGRKRSVIEKRSAGKKAIVTIAPGQKFDFKKLKKLNNLAKRKRSHSKN